jgi:Zn-dependent M28 family amino/carboxypeptidase
MRGMRALALCSGVISSGLVGSVSGCGDDYATFSRAQLAVGLDAAERVDTTALFGRVEALCDARLTDPTRDRSRPDACGVRSDCVYSREAARTVIEQWWAEGTLAQKAALGVQIEDEGGFRTANIRLDLPGRSRPDEWVLGTAHYDAWYSGANDNATGSAVLFEAARALSEMSLDRSVRLLWVDGEELGMVGTQRYIDVSVERIVMVLNADMIAFRGRQSNTLTADSVEYWMQANEQSAEAAFRVADLARRLPEPITSRTIVYPGNGVSAAGAIFGYSMSDHAPFWLIGVPAVFPFPTGDMPDWYHTPRDAPDKVDQSRLRRIGRLWAAALAAFATVAA